MIPETSPGVWRRLETLFHSAAELPPAERSIYLDEQCAGDSDLRERLEMLLAAADKTSGFIEKSVHEAARYATIDGDAAGRRIGEYRLRRELGAGGMGRVFFAERADGEFEQQVAIKLMHAGFSLSHALVSRFRAERQILAHLEHPHIARLLGGGIEGDGLPYLVMEYIDGVAIVDYCRNRKLPVEQKLVLFRKVCDAVEYAHRHLVVHRDIKPGNILVTQDGTPKLLDFGVAKLLADDLAETGARTLATERFLTPDYASPEQILGEQITTATDVYALGALLHEMLSGIRPFGNKARNPLETARLICSADPEPPSAVAARDSEIPVSEARKIKGDLDNVVSMAMRKEPARRYPSVAQLSADIDAYLAGRPLSAAPDSWRYRARKFVKRHKKPVIAAALMALTLAGFSVVMSVLARRATREQLRSNKEAEFMAGMFQAATPEEARGRTVTARELLDRGARRVDHDLASEPQVRAAMLDNIASAYRSIGVYDQAQVLMQRAYRLNKQVFGPDAPATLRSLNGVAELYRDQGKWPEAESGLRQVLAAREQTLSPISPAVIDTMAELGECLYWEGKNAEAETVLRRALALDNKLGSTKTGTDIRNYLALVIERHGAFPEASALLREALDTSRRYSGADSPTYATTLHNLSSALIDSGDLPEAEAKLRETLALKRKILGKDHPDLPLTLNNLAFVLLGEGKFQAAEPMVDETVRLWTRQYGENHVRVAFAYAKMGNLLDEKGDFDGAGQYYRRALDVMNRTGAAKWMAAGIFESMSRLDLDRHDYPGAEDNAEKALKLRRAADPDDPEIAASLIDIGLARELSGRATQADAAFRQALEMRQRKLPANHPAVMEAKIRLGEALIAEGKLREAEPLLQDADRSAHHSPVHLLAWQVAEADVGLAECLAALGSRDQAALLLEHGRADLYADPRAAVRDMILARAHTSTVTR